MIQYERKYEDAIEINVDTIDLVLRYAPLLLHLESLEELETLLKSQRRISKHAPEELPDNLAQAVELLWHAHAMWALLEREPEIRQDELRRTLGGDQDQWRWLAEFWERMGLVHRKPDGNSYVLSLITRMDRLTVAKCPNCGGLGRASKTKLLHAKECPSCKQAVSFVFLLQEQSEQPT